jgi:hypothetical protein
MLGRRLFQQERASHDADRCHHRGQRGHRPRNAGTIVQVGSAHFAGPTSRVPHICGAGVDRMHASTMVGWRRLIARSGRWHWLMRGFETTLGVAGIVAAGGPDGSDGCGSTG